jgi:anti-anti-sigma factor
MTLEGFEVRPGLQIRDDVLAIGFPGEHVPADAALALLEEGLPAHVQQTCQGALPRLVAVDMRNVVPFSSTALGKLLAIRKMVTHAGWALVLVIGDPAFRDLFSVTRLDALFPVVRDAAELRRLVETLPGLSSSSTAAASGPGNALSAGKL